MTRIELAERVKGMALLMAEVSAELDYFGGLDPEFQRKAAELANAASQAWGWYEHIDGLDHLQASTPT